MLDNSKLHPGKSPCPNPQHIYYAKPSCHCQSARGYWVRANLRSHGSLPRTALPGSSTHLPSSQMTWPTSQTSAATLDTLFLASSSSLCFHYSFTLGDTFCLMTHICDFTSIQVTVTELHSSAPTSIRVSVRIFCFKSNHKRRIYILLKKSSLQFKLTTACQIPRMVGVYRKGGSSYLQKQLKTVNITKNVKKGIWVLSLFIFYVLPLKGVINNEMSQRRAYEKKRPQITQN